MVAAIFLALAMGQGSQEPPPGQRFYLDAPYNRENGTISLLVQRTTIEAARQIGTPKEYPPYRWRVQPGSVSVRFEPTSGQRTKPRIEGLAASLPEPSKSQSMVGGSAETTSSRGKVNWTGCKPGFYRLDASVAIQGQDRQWRMAFDHQIFYWRPPLGYPEPDRVGQKFLVSSRKPTWLKLEPEDAARGLYGAEVVLDALEDLDQFHAEARLKGHRGQIEIRAKVQRSRIGTYPGALLPVYEDAEVIALRAQYVGETLYPMGMYLPILEEDGYCRLRSFKSGKATVRVKGVWRTDRLSDFIRIDPAIVGELSQHVEVWSPLVVVFEAETPALMFQDRDDPDAGGPFIALFPDAWAVERQFSVTSKMQDFPDWKPKPGGFAEPIFREEGMSPKQLAWVYGWPTFVGTLKETLALDEWEFRPSDHPRRVVRFKNGKLLPGEGILSRPPP